MNSIERKSRNCYFLYQQCFFVEKESRSAERRYKSFVFCNQKKMIVKRNVHNTLLLYAMLSYSFYILLFLLAIFNTSSSFSIFFLNSFVIYLFISVDCMFVYFRRNLDFYADFSVLIFFRFAK